MKKNLIQLGSNTAKNGFKNEKDIADRFNNWNYDNEAKKWLSIMNYDLSKIENIIAKVIHGYKADVNVLIKIKFKMCQDIENIQVKLVSNKQGFNQVDKRKLIQYKKMWNIPNDIYETLEYFTGEKLPYKNSRDNRRMFLDELFENNRNINLLKWINTNKIVITYSVLRGSKYSSFNPDWVLIAQKTNLNSRWVLKDIATVIQHYLGDSIVEITPKGSIRIGRIKIQRKGGDNGRESAKMLQFKINPIELFEI